MSYILYIKINAEQKSVRDLLNHYYKNIELNNEDSGINLLIPEDIKHNNRKQITIDHMVSYALFDNDKKCFRASYLYPRSSISKTNYRLANSVGIIDKGYRGNIKAKVDIVPIFSNHNNYIQGQTKLFQVCAPDLEPITTIIITNSLPESIRGTNGFGSTGK